MITTDINSAGLQPTAPTDLLAQLTALVATSNPGYTNNLPGSLIEDISSTDVGALTLIDAARVDLVNSISPTTANSFILNQLGQVYGVQQGIGSNTSVYVTFSGSPGYVINKGFVVGDGVHQYIVQDGGAVAASGQSSALYCVATVAGSWAVPVGTVTQLVTSVPSGFTLTVTNLVAGLPGASAQPLENYRAQVIQAGLATAQGVPNLLKTQLLEVSGVQSNLISVRNPASNQWEIIVGGGDPYQIAQAIYMSIPNISTIVGSTLSVAGFTGANPGVVTTNLNHGYSTGQIITIAGVTPSAFNGTYTITVLSQTTFSVGVNTTGFGTYTSGGVITPNLRNITVSIVDYPDTYSITFVNPPVQTVSMTLTWNTISTNIVSPTAVAQLGQPAIATYINSIAVGQPINTFEVQDAFQNAIEGILDISLLSKMNLVVNINGIATAPATGTLLIYGDPESYFSTNNALITIVQG